ncbi:MAG TPA: shikimate dehydrogenase, partial [Magnetospirillaceae bacterium]|nr:shikimate dehydrogenase [Magnetospirillaceae bacterium]
MSTAYALIGDPVGHSLSPAMQAAAFAAAQVDATYAALAVDLGGLREFVARARAGSFAGFNVTTPLKEAIVAHLDHLTDEAREAGAVNLVRRAGGSLEGHNTDGAGLVAALADVWDWQPRGANALILGSGPAGRAIARALKRAGAVALACWSRNEQTARTIGPPPHRTVDLAVSALPADAIVPDAILESIGPRTLLFDVNYRAARSPFPPRIGAQRSDGLPLLVRQGALSFEWWTGQPAPVAVMR